MDPDLPPQKAAFFGCLLSGYLVHLYVFTNIIPNSDGLSRIFDPQQMTVSGRWFLHFASYFNGFTQMPAVIGLFSVLFLALAAALAVSLLGIRSRALSALSGALMAAFPAVGYTFLYLFTASAYCFAIFLAVLSVSLARRGRWHWLAGCLLLACSMGHLSGLCDGGHRPVPAGHFPGRPWTRPPPSPPPCAWGCG